MRERVLDAIYKKLDEDLENEHLQRQITLLNKASICTIDSFCLEVVRNNFYELENISPNFRIADTTEIELLKQEVIEDIFEKKYEEENENFTKLINTYTSYRDDTPLKDLILKIYTYIGSSPFPEKWLNEKIEMFNLQGKLEEDFAKTKWGEELLKEVEEELIDGITSLEEVAKQLSYDSELEKFYQTIRNDIDMMQGLKNNLHSWDKAYTINQDFKFVTWPRQKVESPKKDEAKIIRDDVKKKLTKVLDKILFCDSKQANQDIYDMYEILVKLEEIILEFGKEFSKRKRDKNIVDFTDIEHFALEILLKEENGEIKPSQVAKRYQEKYEEIAIDEYQDSNLVQEYILKAVSRNNNIFMVGDVKQSIYKFRQAMPELFLDKYNTYKNKETKAKDDNLKIQLFKNFRSRENVLDFTNLIFQDIMSNILGDIEYNQDEYLNLGASYSDIGQNLDTEINIIDLKEQDEIEETEQEELEEERVENIELEARFVANKIKKLIESKFPVWDRKKEKYRDIEYKDIVVLLRSTANTAPIYEQEILNLEMPVFSDSSQEYLDSIEIQTIMCLLKIIDNPIQDIPLVTVLRSFIGGFTDDELVQIRLASPYEDFYTCMQKAIVGVEQNLKTKIQNFLEKLEGWREEQEYLALDEFIWKLYSDTGFYNYVGLMTNGELRQANLKMLFQKAKQYESSNFKGLYNFINFIDKLKLSSGDMGAAKLIGENDNVIRIMSIHKSKGLEFPVVFLSSTGKQFNLMDLNQNVLLHQEMGIGVKYIDYDKQIQYDTLSKAAIRNKMHIETLSEEIRVLYVALTRAKEKLIITGISNDYEKEHQKISEQAERYEKNSNKINPILVKKYKRYLDWIMLVYEYEKENAQKIDLKVHSKKNILEETKKENREEVDVLKVFEGRATEKSDLEKLEKEMNQKYKYQLETTIPTKTSVTNLKQMKLEKEGIIGKDETIELPEPAFINEDKKEKLTGAQKGTLIHLCLQKLDYKQEYDLEKIKNFLQSLCEKEIISQNELENINPYKILEFTKSEIYSECKNAKELYKERPFYINIPACEIYGEDTESEILVQGIIDLYYINENDELVLVDYKTDYVEKGNENELIKKYEKQLELYQRALEFATKKKVSKKYIYSVYLGKSLKI
mgnify:FL=1